MPPPSRRPRRAALLAALAAGWPATELGAQLPVADEPGWTVTLAARSLSWPANGIAFEHASCGFFVGEHTVNRLDHVDAAGVVRTIATVRAIDELALSPDGRLLLAKTHPEGPIWAFRPDGTPLGSFNLEPPRVIAGMAFDAAGDFYLSSLGTGEIFRYPAATLPPAVPAATLYASGLAGAEGIRFSPRGTLFAADFRGESVVEVVPPAGPHLPWLQLGQFRAINMAFDPCTGDLVAPDLELGTIARVVSPGVSTPFAHGLQGPNGIEFEEDGHLLVAEQTAGRVTRFVTPAPCGSCLCPRPEIPAVAGVCAGRPVTLDGRAPLSCGAAGQEYRWREGVTVHCDWSATSTCTVTPPASTVYTLDVRCADGSGACVSTGSVVVTVLPDVAPPGAGNTLRGVRAGIDAVLSWASLPDASTYVVYRSTDKRSWPPLPHVSGAPLPSAELRDVPGPPDLYFYRVAGVGCGGREGP